MAQNDTFRRLLTAASVPPVRGKPNMGDPTVVCGNCSRHKIENTDALRLSKNAAD